MVAPTAVTRAAAFVLLVAAGLVALLFAMRLTAAAFGCGFSPFRYLGINAGLRVAGTADRAEAKAGRATWHTAVLDKLVGG